MIEPKKLRKFGAYFYFNGWENISLGLHLCLDPLNIEIHLPFGFCRIGIVEFFGQDVVVLGRDYSDKRTFGYDPGRRAS